MDYTWYHSKAIEEGETPGSVIEKVFNQVNLYGTKFQLNSQRGSYILETLEGHKVGEVAIAAHRTRSGDNFGIKLRVHKDQKQLLEDAIEIAFQIKNKKLSTCFNFLNHSF